MDLTCGKGCMSQWYCSWCKNVYCDDTECPYRMTGKPTYWSEHEQCKNCPIYKKHWFSLTEKERNKIRKKYGSLPEKTEFLLCSGCKNKYIENNICKGRHKNKIGRNVYYW